jgi:hypothetical protein
VITCSSRLAQSVYTAAFARQYKKLYNHMDGAWQIGGTRSLASSDHPRMT